MVSVPPCHGGGRGFKSRQGRGDEPLEREALSHHGSVAQLVERSTENRKVTGSMPVGATKPSQSVPHAGVFRGPPLDRSVSLEALEASFWSK